MEQSKHYDNLRDVAVCYGFHLQAEKTLEELGELSAAIARALLDCKKRNEMKGEIADVYNLLDQLCLLMDCEDDVQEIAERKMERQMARMASQEAAAD